MAYPNPNTFITHPIPEGAARSILSDLRDFRATTSLLHYANNYGGTLAQRIANHIESIHDLKMAGHASSIY